MPAGTSWATFNQARKTGITKSTEVMGALYEEKPPGLVALAADPNGFDDMPGALRTALDQKGLSEKEIEHIGAWPNGQKEDVRLALDDAMKSDPPRTVLFRWKLHDGSTEDTIIETDAHLTTITFFSPWIKVKAEAGDVTVDV